MTTIGRDRRSHLGVAGVVLPIAGLAVTCTVWVIGGRAGWAKGMVVTPMEALEPLFGESADLYSRATAATVWAALRGLMIGGTLAFLSALLTATVPWLRRSITRLAALANAAPWVAVAPCLLVILGRDRGPTAVAALAVFFFVFVATTVGLDAAPAASHDVLSALGASQLIRMRVLQLPGCWPSVVDGLKLAAPAALAGAIFGEWYGARRGLGVLLIGAMQNGRADRLWAASLLSAACGLIAYITFAGLRVVLVHRFGASITRSASNRHVRRRAVRTVLIEVVTLITIATVLVGVWFAWIELGNISPLVVPRPSRVWTDLSSAPGDYAAATIQTLSTAAIALALGVAAGALTAIAASRARTLAGAIVPVVVVLAATPLVALFPLFARLLGYQPSTVRVLAAAMVFFPVFVYTRSGLAAAPKTAVDALDALGTSAGRHFRLLTLPAAVPHVASGCRIAAGSAVIATVVGESLIGREGLGVEFTRSYGLLDLPRAFGAAIVIVITSVIVFAVAGAVERAVHTRWS